MFYFVMQISKKYFIHKMMHAFNKYFYVKNEVLTHNKSNTQLNTLI